LKIAKDIIDIGVNDKNVSLFEGQYVVDGMTYNSYLIKDEKIVVMDTVDKIAVEEWLSNLERELSGKEVDYLVISHLEPDHSAGIQRLAEKYPAMKLVMNAKTFSFLPQFFEITNLEKRKVIAKEGDCLEIGEHTLQFVMAPMVHWPEVMVCYEKKEKILFSADAFGKFGANTMDESAEQEKIAGVIEKHEKKEEEWLPEARRYYINIVGKFGMPVQTLLKKAECLEIQMICPLHGPILKSNLAYYLEKYNVWSQYRVEENGILIACASPHGNTLDAMQQLKEILEKTGKINVRLMDLTREDITEVVSQAFRYSTLIIASATYNGDMFPSMEQFLRTLKAKNYQKRKVAIIENGTWAPTAANGMKDILSQLKEIEILESVITIHTKLSEKTRKQLEELAKTI